MARALFDLDGTLMRTDTFVDFIRFASPALQRRGAELRLLPAASGYGIGRIRASEMRLRVLRVALQGKTEAAIRSLSTASRSPRYYAASVWSEDGSRCLSSPCAR